jgi:hypothetical protein
MYAFLALAKAEKITDRKAGRIFQEQIYSILAKRRGLILQQFLPPAGENLHGMLLTLWKTEGDFHDLKNGPDLDNILRILSDRFIDTETFSFQVVSDDYSTKETNCDCNRQYGDYRQIYSFADSFLDTRHNDLHTWVAYCFARLLIDKEGGDESIVIPAVILHDIGWKAVPDKWHLRAFGPGKNDSAINRVHEVAGAAIAGTILDKLGYDQKSASEIVRIIENHDSERKPVSINDAIVKDSDKLWRFSAEALIIDPRRFCIDAGVHCAWLKRQIEDWFITESAKRLAFEEQEKRAKSLGMN